MKKNKKEKKERMIFNSIMGICVIIWLMLVKASLSPLSNNSESVMAKADEKGEENVVEMSIIQPSPIPTVTSTPIPTLTPTPLPLIVLEDTAEEVIEEIDESPKNQIRYYDIPLEKEIQEYVFNQCQLRGVDYEIAIGLVRRESEFNHGCTNSNKNGTKDKGLFQVNECNYDYMKKLFGAKWSPTNLYDNIDAGIYILAEAMKADPDPLKYLMVYNMGLSGAKKNWDVGRESTEYSRFIVDYATNVLPGLLIEK